VKRQSSFHGRKIISKIAEKNRIRVRCVETLAALSSLILFISAGVFLEALYVSRASEVKKKRLRRIVCMRVYNKHGGAKGGEEESRPPDFR